MQPFVSAFDAAHQWIFENIAQPVLFHLGMSNYIEDAFTGTMWLLIGLLQMVLLIVVVGTLQRLKPAEPVVDRQQIRVDILYTVIHRLGLFRVALFFMVQPLWLSLFGKAHVLGFSAFHLDQLWPGVTDKAWVSLIIYLLIFDLFDYWYHRAQHRFGRFWALHAVHHSQRQMTLFSDNRNHLLDDFLRSAVLVAVSFVVGVSPGQFVLIVVLTQLLESLSHSNVRMGFGRWFDRVLVSPRYHRHHHAIEPTASTAGLPYGYNFAVLFPVWDILFGTARFDGNFAPTGIHEQLEQAGGRDYGKSFWAQQWIGLKSMIKPS